jgi:hypothetical protein
VRVYELYDRLGELIEQGYGRDLVYDNNGNDVCDVLPPEPQGDPGVMLDCHVDQELRRG